MSKDHNKSGDSGTDSDSSGSNGLDGLPKDTVVPLPQKAVDGFMNNLANDQIDQHQKKKAPSKKPD